MKLAILTDNDLDGAGSALLLKLLYKSKAEEIYIKEITDFQMKNEVSGWFQLNYSKYDKIFITDMFVPDEVVPYVDKEKVVIIDHHQSHVDVKDRFTKCKVLIETETSCVRLIQRIFKGSFSFNPLQEKLFNVIDDYDNYTLRYPETLKLNAVYHSYNKPKTDKFIERFEEGLVEFNTMELNAAKLSLNKLKDLIDTCDFFVGELKG
jgi:oligoribonuclease NrnB/cAMP/cGMP phosphodiesterase (DHH superfamily)